MYRRSLRLTALIATLQLASGTILPLTRRAGSSNSTIALTGTSFGSNYNVEVDIGGHKYQLLLDTGSADLWVISPNFTCIDSTYQPINQSECAFGPARWQQSPTFQPITDQILAIQYGAGNVVGSLGRDAVTVGGIRVDNFTVGVGNLAMLQSDGMFTGIMGMGWPWGTFAHPADFDYLNTSFLDDRILYKPWALEAIDRGLMSEPYYSIAIERLPSDQETGSGGLFGLGALPDVSYSGDFVSVPNEVNSFFPAEFTGGSPNSTLWTLTVNSTITNNETSHASFQVVPDTGNNFNVYPSDLAKAVNAKFDPPANLLTNNTLQDLSGQDVYTIDCDATPPTHGIVLGNQTFYHDPRDMIVRIGDVCVSAISGTSPVNGLSVAFLGDAFFKNAIAVFDYGKNEMRFAARANSTGSSSGSPPPSTNAASMASLHSTVTTLLVPLITVLALFIGAVM